jgi:predicted PurR-regulated permease PerM
MENEIKYTEKLAKYILIAAGAAIIFGICWFFKNVITYILAAVVVSLIAKPLVNVLKKIKIKGKHAPDWVLATFALVLVLACFFTVAYVVVPIAGGIIKNISLGSIETSLKNIAGPLADLNSFLTQTFPRLGEDFRVEVAVIQELQNLFNVSLFSSWIGSAASFFTSLAIGLFSVVFIGFFFIKDDGLFTEIVCALVPDKHEKTTEKAISDIGHLLSRYFIGVLVEVLGVALINFLGLSLVARLGVNAALGIAVITGIFNVIPYVGPFIGIVTGTILGLVIKYSSMTPLGLDVGFWAFTAILIAILYFTQLVDNFVYQPLIYSTSIKAKPLEIFIVLLVVGYIGGPLAMIIAIPSYTVVRVIAFRFFGHVKAIRRLIPDEKLITSAKE